jgi:uncharacterized SAM-binding protein YcdF (DUF218 family)
MFRLKKAALADQYSRGRVPMRGACQLVALSVLAGGCTEAWPELPEDLRVEAIVVLGNRPPTDVSGRVMPETNRRVERGVELYQRGHAPILLMTGGPAPRGAIESEVMRSLAVELGVPEDAIRIETKSRNTIENARFTKQLLSEQGEATHRPKIILVTSPYHLGRARRLFDCAGFEVRPAASEAPPSILHRIGSTAYEIMAAVYYVFIDECARSRTGRPSG